MADRRLREGFLEKMLGPLGDGAERRALRGVGDPIRDHLSLLLNTRRGAVWNLPDYGMPEISVYYKDYPTSLGTLRASLERLIEKYEPRLRHARVRLLDTSEDEFRVSFLITGEIDDAGETSTVEYRTTIASSGQVALHYPGEF